MLWIASQPWEGFHRSTYEGKSQIEAKQIHSLHYNIEEGLHLMVVLPCDLCPHHHQQHHRLLRDSIAFGGDGKFEEKKNDEVLTEEDLEAAAQLMELSSQSLHVADDFVTSTRSSMQDAPESSTISDDQRFCGVSPSLVRVSEYRISWRGMLDVEIDERRKPRSRCVSEICNLDQQSRTCKRKKSSVRA
eukprot:Gb_22397 [translate_table: standard]